MPAKKVKEISELLNEEKWTRATLNNYTVSNFKELDKLIDKNVTKESEADIKELCDEHLLHTRNSIIALYISGIITLSKQQIDDTQLVTLINIFADNRKWKIVEYLCDRILQYGENKFALRTLAECYDNENEKEKKYDIWERLIKVDYEEADIVFHLAEKKENDGDIDATVDYYKKAIHRYISKKAFSNVKEIWHKLIEFCPNDIDFFYHVDTKISKLLSPDRASQLLEDLYSYVKEQGDWNRGIDILKRILDYDSKNQSARKEITECYKEKYSHHSQLDEYIRLSNLSQTWRNVHEAIEDFEKHISFDKGNFVCHRSWGVGRIAGINDDEIVIDFARKRGHTMSLKMAVSALTSLGKDHIWVLRTIWSKSKLHDKVKADPKWALRTIIKSHNNAANMKMIKAEVSPGILTAGEWSRWSTETRRLLKTDPDFGNLPDKIDFFMVRENPISYEEKTFNRFLAEKDFFGRLKTIQEFLQNSDPESEYFGEMFEYFTGFLKTFTTVNEMVISGFLLIMQIVKKYPFLNPGFDFTFNELFDQIEDLEEKFSAIEDADLKHDFLENVRQKDEWEKLFVRLFPSYLSRFVIDQLSQTKSKQLANLLSGIMDNYREYREAFIWLAKTYSEEWFEENAIPYEKILIGMIHLLDISFREIENKRNVSENRKINRQIHTYLFKDKRLELFLASVDKESINRIYTLVEDVRELDPSIKIEMRQKIMDRFPDYQFRKMEKSESVSFGLIVTALKYQERRKELQDILEVEVPNSSKEIAEALEKGDLRENAEYKAAKEKQDLLNNTAAKLKEDLDKAQIFDEKDIDTTKISFSTRVILVNLESDEEESFVILGPWESDPSRNIISYLSPFGAELWSHSKGQNLDFVINDREHRYKVKDILPYSDTGSD